MAGRLVPSIIAFAVGAVLDFAVTVGPDQHGFNIHTIGVILMIVGVVGAVLCLIALFAGSGPRRHRATVDDGRGNVVRRMTPTSEDRCGLAGCRRSRGRWSRLLLHPEQIERLTTGD